MQSAQPPAAPEPEVPGAKPGRAAFIFIFITVALDMLALGVIVPVLPKLVVELSGGDAADGARMFGLFGTAWALMQLVFSPVLGSLSDRFGRRPVILLSNFGLGLDYVLMALAPTIGWLFVGRVISGITAASFSTAGAYIADVTPSEKRAARFGMLGAAFGLGFVLGPAIGGMLGHIDPRLPFWCAAGLSLLNAVYGVFVLPESLPKERRARFSWSKANPIGSLVLLRSHPELLGLASIAFLSGTAHEVLHSTFVLYTDYRFHWDERTVGWVLAAVGVSSTIVQGGLVGAATRRLGEWRALRFGLFCGFLGFLIYAIAPTTWWFLLGLPVSALWGFAGPNAQGLMTRRVSPSEQGQLQGAISSLRGIAGLLGPLLFTQTFASVVGPGHPIAWSGAPFMLAAILLCASLGTAWTIAPARNQ
jgi:DHA1 family tetracycline resistance protein-like MFS transporter